MQYINANKFHKDTDETAKSVVLVIFLCLC